MCNDQLTTLSHDCRLLQTSSLLIQTAWENLMAMSVGIKDVLQQLIINTLGYEMCALASTPGI